MKNSALSVVPQPDAGQVAPPQAPASGELEMPSYFSTAKGAARIKDAWRDLVSAADAEVKVAKNRFAFEMAAVLLAKFRSGKAMNATDSKELKRHMIFLGLAQADDAGGKRPRKATDKYFDG